MIGQPIRAIVVDNIDPQRRRRVLVSIPKLGVQVWALPTDEGTAVPRVDDVVSALGGQDPDTPYVYLGKWPRSKQRTTSEREERDATQEAGTKTKAELVTLVNEAARRHGLPEAFLRAIVTKESVWNPRARSGLRTSMSVYNRSVITQPNLVLGGGALKDHRNFQDNTKWDAYGLAQVLPTTALSYGLKHSEDPEVVLLDPERNIDIAARYLSRLYDLSGQVLATTAAMYFAGAGSVPSSNPKDWVDDDTRAYSRRVMKIYAAELEGEGNPVDVPPSAFGEDDEMASPFSKGSQRIDAPSAVDDAGIEVIGAASSHLPFSFQGANYPDNRAVRSPSGHLFEVDDTEGAERIHAAHAGGRAHFEWGSSGQRSEHFSGSHRVVDGADRERAGAKVDIAESRRRHTSGAEEVTVGALNEVIEGPEQRTIKGGRGTRVIGADTETIVGTKTIKAIGELNLVGVDTGLGGKRVRVHGVEDAVVVGVQGARVGTSTGKKVLLGNATSDALKQKIVLEASLVWLLQAQYQALEAMSVALTAGLTVATGAAGAASPAVSPTVELVQSAIAAANSALLDKITQAGLGTTESGRRLRTSITEAD